MARGRSRSDSRSRSRGRGKGGRGDESENIQQMVDERQAARRDRDFDKADRMREELKEMGVRIDAELGVQQLFFLESFSAILPLKTSPLSKTGEN